MSRSYPCRYCGRPIVFRTLKREGMMIVPEPQAKGRVVPIHLEDGGCQLRLRL